MDKINKYKIAVVGLGYVGLPLAVEFSKYFKTIGFDIDEERINELNNGDDSTLEIKSKELKKALNSNSKNGLRLTVNPDDLAEYNFYIVTVPTPINELKKPDLKPLISATNLVAGYLKADDFVVFESTVFPGATEEICIPKLETISGLKYNKDFYVGYSPERINPGDKKHTLTKILKVTSGSNQYSAEIIDNIYKKIIVAGTFKASSIKVAEAAKVIENSQRDINIAFINELSKIFGLLGINTFDVLEAASTKWNFLNFVPGLVGGHCIGVDPYYLASKAMDVGYNPKVILSGREVNDSMASYVANRVENLILKNNKKLNKSSVLILGITFKENCPDIRNSKVIDIINLLKKSEINVKVFDPWPDRDSIQKKFNIKLEKNIPKLKFDAIVLCVQHDVFKEVRLENLKKKKSFVFDLKNFYKDSYDYTL